MQPAASCSSASEVPRSRVVRVKVLSMGDVGVGKSCLIKRYCEDKFISRYIPTIGIDYGVKPVRLGDHELRVNLWDLAGSPDYLEVRSEFYKEAQAALLCFDATSRPSFDALATWLAEACAHSAPASMAVFVVATKADLPGRRVTEAEGREWAAARGCAAYYEASAATGRGVQPLFAALFSAIVSQLPQMEPQLVTCAAAAAAGAAAADGLAALQLA